MGDEMENHDADSVRNRETFGTERSVARHDQTPAPAKRDAEGVEPISLAEQRRIPRGLDLEKPPAEAQPPNAAGEAGAQSKATAHPEFVCHRALLFLTATFQRSHDGMRDPHRGYPNSFAPPPIQPLIERLPLSDSKLYVDGCEIPIL